MNKDDAIKKRVEELEREVLLAAYNTLTAEGGLELKSIIKAFVSAEDKKNEINTAIKEDKSLDIHFHPDIHHICASAIYAQLSYGVDISKVHPYCNGGATYVEFAQACICLDKLNDAYLMIEDGCLWGERHAKEILNIIEKEEAEN